MSTAVLTKRAELNSAANRTLKTAAQSWFVLTLIGQLTFAFSIASFYGLTAMRGDLQSWNSVLIHGYISGETMGNTAFAVHILFASLITVVGAVQLIPQIRNRYPAFHHWNGRLYVLAAFPQGLTGFYLTGLSGRKIAGDVYHHAGLWIDGILIMLCAVLTLRYALKRDFKTHRRWALRLFIVASASWFFRVGFFLTLLLFGPIGFDKTTFRGPLFTFWAFAEYLIPLAVLELYLRAQDRPGALRRYAMAGGLFVVTLAMGAGMLGVAMFAWLPMVKAAYAPGKSIATTLSATIASNGIDQAVKQYRDLKASQPDSYNFNEAELNTLGHQLIQARKFKEAIHVLQLNVEAYPQSSAVYDSLAEAYMDDGNKLSAIASYRKSLQLNPKEPNAANMLQKLNAPW
jgi:hypothetical protein